MLNPLTDINGIRVLSRLGRPTRSSRAPTDMIPTRAPSRAPFAVAVGITSGPRTCSRAPVGSKTRRRDRPGGTALDYLDKRRGNMRYGWLRRNGYCISSSHVEAAARILVARRCKQAGMHWRHHNAACVCAIIARLRSVTWGPPRWTTTSSTKLNRTPA